MCNPTTTPISNPWTHLPLTGNQFVLPSDFTVINTKKWINNPLFQYHLNLNPEPFIGNPKAPVIALNLNPGYDPNDIIFHSKPLVKKAMLDNISHNNNNNYYLDPILNPHLAGAPGKIYWEKRLKSLITATSMARVANGLFIMEFVPYHSIKFKSINLPSQLYNDYLLAQAISRSAIIIIMRGKTHWFNRNPSLIAYSRTGNLLVMNNPQQPYFSPNNLPNFQRLVSLI